MILTEILETIYDWRFSDQRRGRYYNAKFRTADNSMVTVVIIMDVAGQDTNIASVTFSRDLKQGLTGEGDALRIFATVIDIISKVIKVENPTVITYSAVKEESSRVSLYDRLAKRFKPPDYEKIDITTYQPKNERMAQIQRDLISYQKETFDVDDYAFTTLVKVEP